MKIPIKSPNPVESLILLIFIFTIILGVVLIVVLPKDDCGNLCDRGAARSFIQFTLLFLLFLPLIIAITGLIKKKISKSAFIGTLIILSFLLIVWLVYFSEARCKLRWAVTMANMRQLATAQEMFYGENDRYADTQEELIEAGFFREKFKDWVTDKELTDKDGKGIEGGDDNPGTWLATAYIPSRKIDKWCRLIGQGYWYTCDQSGCYEGEVKTEKALPREEMPPDKIIEDETVDWKTYRNEEYGFEFKYPKEFAENEFCMARKTEGGVKVGWFIFISIEDSNGLNLSEYIDSVFPKEFNIESEENITVGSEEAVKINYSFSGPGTYGEAVFLLKDKKAYLFELAYGNNPCVANKLGIDEFEAFEHIISTFRFLE